MAEEIIRSVSSLRIDEEEDQILDIANLNPNNENNVSLLLIGKLLTERSYNVDAFKKTITTVWAPQHGLVIRTLKPNLYAFQFYHWRDMSKVMEGRPWCFDNMLVLLKEAEGDEQPDQVIIHHSPFWIRLKNLPLNMRSNDVVKALIGNMGEILDIEDDVLGIGRYRRVKVLLDVNKPLRRYRKIRDRKGADLQVDFAYERLPFFCLACGIMGHAEKDCHSVFDEDKCERLGWHMGLKATPRKGRNRELEEEAKFKNCKKVLFDNRNGDVKHAGGVLIKEADKHLHELVCGPSNSEELIVAAVDINEPTLSKAPNSLEPLHVDPTINEGPLTSQNSPTEIFFFSSVKEASVVKKRAWKRLARGPMIDKGGSQMMEMDPEFMVNKRPPEHSLTAGNLTDDATMKRPKLSASHDVVYADLAEVGDDQPRQSL